MALRVLSDLGGSFRGKGSELNFPKREVAEVVRGSVRVPRALPLNLHPHEKGWGAGDPMLGRIVAFAT